MKALIKEMCDLQKHGGPDDEGQYSCAENNVVLGHRRLALLDLSSAGHQPMVYQDRYVITFNGEIYNFKELRKELIQSGMLFHTHCDTEVILAAFAHWNTQSFARLSGMFAFALYDMQERNMYLVRDASGIKPLYYASTATSIEFASEIRAFAPLKNKKENAHWPVYQLAYGHLPEPVTTLQDVRPLHKGFFYKYNTSSGAGSLQSFSHYSFSSILEDRITAKRAIRQSVSAAVKSHLIADAPIGSFLSGGLDSGILASLACLSGKEHLKTLSLYFKEPQFSEKIYQDSLIKILNCQSYQHLLTESEFQESFPAILEAMDMPGCDGLNTWFISKYAKVHGLKAVLSGIGADELFGGYPSFNRIRLAAKLQRMPKGILRINAGKDHRYGRIGYLSLEGVKGIYLFLRGQFLPHEIARRLGANEKEIWSILSSLPALGELCNLAPKNQASWMELNMYNQNQLLRDADIMGMAHGIEIRVPFLDTAVVRTVLSVDEKIKYAGKLPKQFLINTFKDTIPASIWNRKKMGFSFPFRNWMGENLFVKDTIAKSNKVSQASYKDFLRGRLHWSKLMSLVILQTRGIS